MLEIGYTNEYEVRSESYPFPDQSGFSVLYLSDLHVNRYSSTLIDNLEVSINSLNPSVVLLGGDYFDSKGGIKHFQRLLAFLSQRSHVFAIAGNHDYFFGIKSIQKMVEDQGITWLEGTSYEIEVNGLKVQVTNEVSGNVSINTPIRILCVHQPIDPEQIQGKYHIVLAGHLHGCQVVLWETEKGLYPGRWFYRRNFLKANLENCLYLISKGLGDTLPIRYNCKKDILLVTIGNPVLL
ncbi:metallophosphoesterase [Cytophagaceae bacterium DM2B3-1]|uniref:Metallophosphoesterase n=1 Tax=Xanthocytophaga flava TaxID=3048013 RepID=A0ABT7CUB8_9BACT|nr:metallophosphoesterase [Xanthocytophaga flavus]MDJ1497305.1 metallophosphoesterase [Xanthocytophaga flavus]